MTNLPNPDINPNHNPLARRETRQVSLQEFLPILESTSEKLDTEITAIRTRRHLHEGIITEQDLEGMIEISGTMAYRSKSLVRIFENIQAGKQVPVLIETNPDSRSTVYFDLDAPSLTESEPDESKPSLGTIAQSLEPSVGNGTLRIVTLDELPAIFNETSLEIEQKLQAFRMGGSFYASSMERFQTGITTISAFASEWIALTQILEYIHAGKEVPVITRVESGTGKNNSFFDLNHPILTTRHEQA